MGHHAARGVASSSRRIPPSGPTSPRRRLVASPASSDGEDGERNEEHQLSVKTFLVNKTSLSLRRAFGQYPHPLSHFLISASLKIQKGAISVSTQKSSEDT